MEQIKVESNDTTIVLPSNDIKISTESIGGAMYATVYLNALQPGFATITFREKDESQQPQSEQPVFIYKNPEFLRSFLSIHVLSSSQCDEQFGVIFDDFANRNVSQQSVSANNVPTANPLLMMSGSQQRGKQDSNYKNGKNWQHSKTAKDLHKNSNSMYAAIGALILLIIICCSWGNWQHIFMGGAPNENYSNMVDPPPAAFNPYARMNDTINQSNQWQM